MKLSRILMLVTALLIMSAVHAQFRAPKDRTPKWVSDKGYWQIETNIKTPRNNIIYFYTNENVLIYKERLDNVILRLEKYSVKMRLRKALDAALTAWNKSRKYQDDQQLVSMMLRK